MKRRRVGNELPNDSSFFFWRDCCELCCAAAGLTRWNGTVNRSSAPLPKVAPLPKAPKGPAFWAAAAARLPKAARYDPLKVASAQRDLAGSVMVAPRDRIEWFLAIGELMAIGERIAVVLRVAWRRDRSADRIWK